MKLHEHHKRIGIFIVGFVAGALLIGGFSWFLMTQRIAEDANLQATRIIEEKKRAGTLKEMPQPTTKPSVATLPPAMTPDFTIPVAADGLAPVIYQIPTNLSVVYLGIDDGANKTQQEVELLKQNNIKATLFLSDLFIANNPDFFKQITANGNAIVENHTLSHDTKMSGKPYAYQKQEICGMADKIQQYYGHRPTLFRPPGGAYTSVTRKAASDCGMKAVVTWIAKANGGAMQYQVGDKLRPGDIVLMHFRPEFAQDLAAFVTAAKAAGLHTELLENLKGAE